MEQEGTVQRTVMRDLRARNQMSEKLFSKAKSPVTRTGLF
jgi:hypothetical protein